MCRAHWSQEYYTAVTEWQATPHAMLNVLRHSEHPGEKLHIFHLHAHSSGIQELGATPRKETALPDLTELLLLPLYSQLKFTNSGLWKLTPCPQPYPLTQVIVLDKLLEFHKCQSFYRDRKNSAGIGQTGLLQNSYSRDFIRIMHKDMSCSKGSGTGEGSRRSQPEVCPSQMSVGNTLVEDFPELGQGYHWGAAWLHSPCR